jgi:1-phosphatidylinositol-4-phosphate 5-kinase
LIGIKKSLSCSLDIPGTELIPWEFEKVLCNESEWISSNDEQMNMVFKFYDYAPKVFQRLRKLKGITEEDYMKSLGPEQIL